MIKISKNSNNSVCFACGNNNYDIFDKHIFYTILFTRVGKEMSITLCEKCLKDLDIKLYSRLEKIKRSKR